MNEAILYNQLFMRPSNLCVLVQNEYMVKHIILFGGRGGVGYAYRTYRLCKSCSYDFSLLTYSYKIYFGYLCENNINNRLSVTSP